MGDILAAFRSCPKVEGDFRIAFLRIVATGSQWVGLHAGAIVPVQLPTKFELVINLKTAKVLGPRRTASGTHGAKRGARAGY